MPINKEQPLFAPTGPFSSASHIFLANLYEQSFYLAMRVDDNDDTYITRYYVDTHKIVRCGFVLVKTAHIPMAWLGHIDDAYKQALVLAQPYLNLL
jgi:hypothetical protein